METIDEYLQKYRDKALNHEQIAKEIDKLTDYAELNKYIVSIENDISNQNIHTNGSILYYLCIHPCIR